jgi:hypothetical protein
MPLLVARFHPLCGLVFSPTATSTLLQVQPALDFLLASGLGDPDPDVRELMVTAGTVWLLT